jgi:hypothetical protein
LEWNDREGSNGNLNNQIAPNGPSFLWITLAHWAGLSGNGN